MKRTLIHFGLVLSLIGALAMPSCKNKNKGTNTTTVNTDTLNTTPVEIAPDNQLADGVKDATKDFPGVNATVNDGEVTLTGNIKRDRLPVLMQSLHALNPKKINNNLTVEP